MILTASYMWAVTKGGAPFDTDVMFGTAFGDVIIAAVLFDAPLVVLGGES